ncbi:MAG: hypothetical protein ACI9FR_001637 [Cryomorphaceae bacterium]|jgi:hypothetical protein
MSDYQAPIDDLNFVISKLLDFDGPDTELCESIFDEARKLATQMLSPPNYYGDARTSISKSIRVFNYVH